MRKTIISIGLITMMMFSFTACGGNTASSSDKAAVEASIDFDGSSYSETGDGNVYISTPGGTSENGNIPVMFVEKDTILTQIEVDAWETDNTHLGYIYVDGKLADKAQLGDVQFTINLTDDALSEGNHKVEVVLYDNDEPDGNVILYRMMQYECKIK